MYADIGPCLKLLISKIINAVSPQPSVLAKASRYRALFQLVRLRVWKALSTNEQGV